MKRRYTLADVRESYPPEKAREEWYGDWASALVYRPISFFVTLPLLNLSTGASQVTFAALLVALALPLAAACLPDWGHGAVAFLAIAFSVLDCVDGNIARVTKTESKRGHYLDFLTDIVFRIAFYASVGILADREMSLLLGTDGLGLLLALLAALVTIVGRLSRVFARGLSPGDVFDENPASKGIFARALFPFLSGLDRALPVLMLAADRFGGLPWLVLWLLAYGLGDFLYTQFAIFRRLGAAS